MSVRTYRYELPALGDGTDSWSVVFVDETGCFAVLSDYGHWSFRWNVHHTGQEDFRYFLLGMGADYLASKIGSVEQNREFDPEATETAIKERIARLDDYDIEEEVELFERSDIDCEAGFQRWVELTQIDEPWNLARFARNGGLNHWVTVSFERLKTLVREELARERAGAT